MIIERLDAETRQKFRDVVFDDYVSYVEPFEPDPEPICVFFFSLQVIAARLQLFSKTCLHDDMFMYNHVSGVRCFLLKKGQILT